MTTQHFSNHKILFGFLVAVGLFCVANITSYFLRSSGFGVLEVNDGVTRIGFPLIMFERGGIDGHVFFHANAVVANTVFAGIVGFIAGLFLHFVSLRSRP